MQFWQVRLQFLKFVGFFVRLISGVNQPTMLEVFVFAEKLWAERDDSQQAFYRVMMAKDFFKQVARIHSISLEDVELVYYYAAFKFHWDRASVDQRGAWMEKLQKIWGK